MSDYSDDRYGLMRMHIATERARLACDRYSRDHLRSIAKAKGSPVGSLRKHDMAWYMAQNGLIDAAGYLRDGFPQPTDSGDE